MNRYSVLIILTFFISSLSISQNARKKNQKPNFIPWTNDRKLKISDFKLIKKKFGKNDYTGMTYTDIQYDYKFIKDSLFINIKAVFNTKLSWLNSGDTTLSGLRHEQVHFDICEIMSRQMRKEFYENYDLNASYDFNSNLKKLRRKYLKKLNKLNRQYDKETNHGVNKLKQSEWEKTIIPKLLIQNESYNNAMILITKD